MEVPPLDTTLVEIESMLRRYAKTREADLIAQLARTHHPEEFAEDAVSLAIWGGQGSVVDVNLVEPGDDRRLNEQILNLAFALDDLGLSTPRTRWVAQTIEDWLISHPTQ